MYLQLFLIVALPILFYIYNRCRYYFKYYAQGLDGPRPLPLLGNSLKIMWRPFKDYETENFKTYGETYVDYIIDNRGVIVTSKVDLVKQLLVSNFHNFYHRLQPTFMHVYARKAVIFLNADWKRVRSQITPVFTTSRLKTLFKNFKHPIETTLGNIQQQIDAKKGDHVDTKLLMKAFSLDIIANVVFSLKTNSWHEDDFSRKVMDLFKIQRIVISLLFMLPKFMVRFFQFSFMKKTTIDYFSKLTLTLIDERKKNKDVVYNDFIELLLKSEASEVGNNIDETGHINKKLTQEEIVGQCFIFFVAGMETISTALSLLLYELAINQEIQDKLYKDLITCHPTDDVAYDDLNASKYLDNVLNEALRKHTTLNRIFRQAVSDYDFGDFKVKRGQTIGVSLYNIHMNEKLFKDPHKFRPERFDNPEEIPFQPIPFVDGPRNCIGNRFALVEMKALLIPLLKTYRVFATSKTDIPLKTVNSVILNMVESINLGFEKRMPTN